MCSSDGRCCGDVEMLSGCFRGDVEMLSGCLRGDVYFSWSWRSVLGPLMTLIRLHPPSTMFTRSRARHLLPCEVHTQHAHTARTHMHTHKHTRTNTARTHSKHTCKPAQTRHAHTPLHMHTHTHTHTHTQHTHTHTLNTLHTPSIRHKDTQTPNIVNLLSL